MGDAGAAQCLDLLFSGLSACTAADAGDGLAVLQGCGSGRGAFSRATNDVQRLAEDPDVPCLKSCCTRRCMHDAFNMRDLKATFTKMQDLKAAIEAKQTTEAAPLIKGPSKPRIATAPSWWTTLRRPQNWKAWLTESLRPTESQALLDFYSLTADTYESTTRRL